MEKEKNGFQAWLYGRWGPLGKSLGFWLREVVYPEGALCCACGRLSDGEPLCAECRQRLREDGFVFAWDYTEPCPGVSAWGLRPHDGIHRTLVLRLKYGAESRAAGLLASLVLPLPEGLSFPPDTVVTWVTMPPSRLRDRGIDHGRLLAEAVAENLSLSCRPLLLRRETRQKSQVSLSASGRTANLKNAFEPLEAVHFPVLLVDDVRTTGTTIARCAEALRRGGATRIFALTMTFGK